jgi:hypothetical protein
MNYHKITVRCLRNNKYLVLTENGSYWTQNDGNATAFESVDKGLDYIRTNLDTKDEYRYHVTAFYRDRQGFLAWHYIYI